jgi:U3 small nucleolar RNA-associated protein 20
MRKLIPLPRLSHSIADANPKNSPDRPVVCVFKPVIAFQCCPKPEVARPSATGASTQPNPLQIPTRPSYKQPTGLTQEALRARAAAVAHVALQHLLNHTRRGGCGPIWDAALAAVAQRLSAADGAAAAAADAPVATTNGSGGDGHQPGSVSESASAAAEASAARAVLHLAQAVAFYRGSRVEDYAPILSVCQQLVQRLGRSIIISSNTNQQRREDGSSGSSSDYDAQWDLIREASEVPEPAAYEAVRLPAATLQLLLAVAHGHLKAVGASHGLPALARVAPIWAPAFGAAASGDDLLCFAHGLVFAPGGGPELPETFAPQLLGALGRLVLDGSSSGGGGGSSGEAAGDVADRALVLLVDACDVLRPGAAAGQGLPLLLTARPGGAQLAERARRLVSDWRPGGAGAGARQALLRCWAGLQLLPHACDKAAVALELCCGVINTIDPRIASLTVAVKQQQQQQQQQQQVAGQGTDEEGQQHQQQQDEDAVSEEAAAVADLLQLRAAASATLVHVLPAVAPAALPAAAAAAMALAAQHPLDYPTVDAAAGMLEALRSQLEEGSSSIEGGPAAAFEGDASALGAAQGQLSLAGFESATRQLAPALTAAPKRLRGAALRALCAFEQPSYAAGRHEDANSAAAARGQAPAFTGVRCEALELLRDMHCQNATLERGRKWSVALGRMQNHFEYGRMPAAMLVPVLAGLIGVSHIRFQPLWEPAAEAMGTALSLHEKIGWPLLLAQLRATQAAFLAGGGLGHKRHRSVSSGPTGADDGSSNSGNAAAEAGASLAERFDWHLQEGSVGRGGGSTDDGARLGWLLKAASKAASEVLERGGRDWVPLFLGYAAVGRRLHGDLDAEEGEDEGAAAAAEDREAPAGEAGAPPTTPKAKAKAAAAAAAAAKAPTSGAKRKRGDAGGGAGGSSAAGWLGVGGKAWRAQMLEWLGVLAAVKGARSLFRATEVQRAAAQQLLSPDPALQSAAVKCLRPFRLPYLPGPLAARLLRLADNGTLREELVGLPMTQGAEGGIQDEHRAGESLCLRRLVGWFRLSLPLCQPSITPQLLHQLSTPIPHTTTNTPRLRPAPHHDPLSEDAQALRPPRRPRRAGQRARRRPQRPRRPPAPRAAPAAGTTAGAPGQLLRRRLGRRRYCQWRRRQRRQ